MVVEWLGEYTLRVATTFASLQTWSTLSVFHNSETVFAGLGTMKERKKEKLCLTEYSLMYLD